MHHLHASDFTCQPAQGTSRWERLLLNQDIGKGYTDTLRFSDGLALVYTHYQPEYELHEHSDIERKHRSLTLTLALDGHSYTRGPDGQCFHFAAGHSTLVSFTHVRGQRYFPAQQQIRQLRLIADEHLLSAYGLQDILSRPGAQEQTQHLHFGRYNAASQALAQSVLHLHKHSPSVLDIQIAAMSLLAEQLRPTLKSGREHPVLTGADQDRIHKVQAIMQSQFHKPLSVAYLCACVGTNQFKLKQGFHQLFGTTPHRMLTDIRMRAAWQKLESGQSVSSVAEQVGFQHLSSFSAAFERYYGRSPSVIAKAARPA